MTSGLSGRGANPPRFVASRSARKRSSSAESKQADTTHSYLKVLEDEPNINSYIDEMCGACAYYSILRFYFYLILQIDCTIVSYFVTASDSDAEEHRPLVDGEADSGVSQKDPEIESA